MMEAVSTSETFVKFYQTIRCNIPENVLSYDQIMFTKNCRIEKLRPNESLDNLTKRIYKYNCEACGRYLFEHTVPIFT
jgi:hypothetical protein